MRETALIMSASILLGSILFLVREEYALAAVLVPATYLAVKEAQRHRKQKSIEEELPRAMLELATLPVHSLRDVIEHLSRGYGELSREFQRAKRLVSAGIPPEKALRSVADANESYLLNNAISIIITGVRSGSDWSDLIRSAAEDIEALIDMERERTSALALQRYVVLLSAAVFVPGVLGITKKMAKRLTDGGFFEAVDTLTAVQDAVIIHIALLSIMSAVFAAFLEGKPRKAIVYSAILLPIAFGTYAFVSGMGI